jgi:serine/threonine protein kinase/tetratricopeptide (TPR) repeat protein
LRVAMPTDLRKAREIFLHAVGKLPAEQWDDYVAEACAGDHDLAQQVESLLQVHREAGSFLDAPAPGLEDSATSTAHYSHFSEGPGAVIGPYKLLQQIGEGGMGAVFMAEQSAPLQRTVALKIIKPGMDSRQVIARFEAERQAVAMMDHPNIAKVLDAGTTDSGRPYFVMELVKGVPITQFCDGKRLCLRDRLELFTHVCQAVQHAHQKGVIHRDLKPTNVLVAEYDNRAVPKVIDFGVAKATGQRLTERTMFTEFGQVLGTMEYMSPEQAKLNQLDVDTRSDIYSLGVLLYELLAGSTPFAGNRLKEAAFDEMLRIIREEEPPKPSTRLSSLSLGERAGVTATSSLASIASNRHTEPARLSKDVRGELDWIVMRALEKDRNRRYETATGFAADVERHLQDQAVEAGPPSAAYRFRKFVSRNRAALATLALVSAALVLGTVVSTWQAVRATTAARIADTARLAEGAQRIEAERQRRQAEASERLAHIEAAKSRQVAQFLKDMLGGAGPWVALGQDTTLLRSILDRTATRIDTDLANQPEVQGELFNEIGLVYWSIGEPEKSEAAYRQAVAVQRRTLGGSHPDLANSLFGLAQSLEDLKRPEESEALYRESLEMRRAIYGNEHWQVAACLNNITSTLVAQGKFAEAEAICREALSMKRKLFPGNHPELAISLRDLGLVRRSQGKLLEAERLLREALAIFRQALGDTHPDVAITLGGLADVLSAAGNLAEAETVNREALAIKTELYESNSFHVNNTRLALIAILEKQGKLAEADLLRREMAPIADPASPPSSISPISPDP